MREKIQKEIRSSFSKFLQIVEQRQQGLDIRSAVLLLDTSEGQFYVSLKDDISDVVLGLQFFNNKVVDLVMRPRLGNLVMCGDCVGRGVKMSPDGTYQVTCDRCHGGGQLIISKLFEQQEIPNGTDDAADNDDRDEPESDDGIQV